MAGLWLSHTDALLLLLSKLQSLLCGPSWEPSLYCLSGSADLALCECPESPVNNGIASCIQPKFTCTAEYLTNFLPRQNRVVCLLVQHSLIVCSSRARLEWASARERQLGAQRQL